VKLLIRNKIPPNPSPQEVFDILVQSRIDAKHSTSATEHFLSPPHPSLLNLVDFGFEKTYVEKAMECIWHCHPLHPNNATPHKPIIVYTDYDADGITGGTILWETLHTLGFTAFPYTPNRISEGYGFSTPGLDRVKSKYDPALIISVDHGITADAYVSYALETLNIPIIVTDHHHRQEEKVPKRAQAVFHIPVLSGSGTAYYVAKEISNSTKYRVQSTEQKEEENKTVVARNEVTKQSRDLERMFDTDYIGVAAIGTIADLVPLQGASRSIAFHGLKALTSTSRPGLVALKKVADHIGKTVTTYEVGFLLAPRINASGRLEDALDAVRLLCTKDATKARSLAEKLNRLNVQRQNMVKEAVEEALKMVEAQMDQQGILPKIIFVYQQQVQNNELSTSASWHEGIIGLIASKICEKYHRPTIVLTIAHDDTLPSDRVYREQGRTAQYKPPANNEKDDVKMSDSNHDSTLSAQQLYKASCRSIPGFHLTDYLSAHQKLLEKFGGHEAAAGFSIEAHKLNEFITQSCRYADTKINDAMLERTVTADCELPLTVTTAELAVKLESMAPFGVGNPKPVFVSHGIVQNVRIMGKDGAHARFILSDNNSSFELVAFGKAEEIQNLAQVTKPHWVVYTLDMNRFNGSEKVQGKFIATTT